VASWLVRSSPDRAVRARALAGDTVLCFRQALYSLSDYLHPGVQKGTGEFNAGGNPVMDSVSHKGRSRNVSSRFMLQKSG